MEIRIEKNELRTLIKEAVKEVFEEKALEFFLRGVPAVSKEEMTDVENLYGKPSCPRKTAHSEDVEI